jgi:hypothetical protein
MLPGGLQAQVFTVPGKVPLYLESDSPETAAETEANVGIELCAGNACIGEELSSAARILADVGTLLRGLADKRLLEL